MAKKPTFKTHTVQIQVKAPKRLSSQDVGDLIDTLIAAGISDAEASAGLSEEDQMIDPTDALSLNIGSAHVTHTEES